ncbi:MAG: glucose-1-phosphate thymidylyltransferase [Ignavibacteria bacterium GWB2_35_12]|nr:MAG: glucose-1-phosphate thymidylyltransferase [Ignavibacteria bacterium GWA2_35_8]OGU42440.1 MAG: glucose-1-phosphate thymidylyltransferase [Ignavibacteria bacterium GWB2_35_12]OGU96609.1 MAG: glucose-1-phosphate thymidylyltransferase [Ignavibacteria bacterium RIFOXYA2_FULL_35_10]OGV24220.1 MAG: glucose-1-phosphate thymidylyltransferase [Ignavibacteria bacterium RIFOXYC2_FULL_35_21]
MNTKGIILAGGSGTRLYPMTAVFSKQLQAVYDKPMIYYPLAILMLAGIREILVISTPEDTPNYKKLLGDGSNWGISLSYKKQDKPGGIAEAFIYGEDFIEKSQVCLILGDNIFYGKLDFLRNALEQNKGGTIFGYPVNEPGAYGVVEFDKDGNVLSIEEKPKAPKSKYAIPGLYVFSKDVVKIAKNIDRSPRGELEITDVQLEYNRRGKLRVELIGRGIAWLDTGTPESLMEASTFIHAIEKRQGHKIACLEEIALEMNFISLRQYLDTVNNLPNCSYKDYCLAVVK